MPNFLDSHPPHLSHEHMRIWAVLFAFMWTVSVLATTLPSIQIAELFQQADIVVVAQVTGGELIGIGKDSCGAKYFAHVEESFKGSSKDATIEFGNSYGYEVGSRYLLFLTGPGRVYEPVMSTNSASLRAKTEILTRCETKWARNAVMHSGYGALPIQWTEKFNYKDGVRVPTRYVVLPKTVETAPAIFSEREEFSNVVWIKLEDMTQLLRKLGD